MENATRFLDTAALHWTKHRQCFACHTNFAYLIARPKVNADNTAHRELRAALEEMVEKRWETDGPRWDAEVVMSAATLALNDAATTGELQPTTRKALARMWHVQRADGGFDWVKCGWPPMESDDDYGIAIAALALGAAPDDPRIQRGLQWLKANQRESGRWFTRSLNKDNKHFLSHAGTAFAVLALTACDEK